MSLKLDLKDVGELLERPMEQAVRKLARAVHDGFEDPAYAWPGVTKRRSGEVAGTVRDVKDLGTLQRSQQEPVRVAPGQYQLAWTAEHAAAVFLGAVYKRRKGSMPARNVPLNVLRDFDFPAAYAQAWRTQ